MQRLCTLNLIFLFITIGFAPYSLAEPAAITNTFTTTSSSGPIRVGIQTDGATTGAQHQINFNTARTQNGFRFDAGVTNTKNDYSNYLIFDDFGRTTPLSQTFDQVETFARLAGDYAQGPHGVNLTYAQTLTSSPFASRTVGFGYLYRFNYDLSTLGFSVTSGASTQPANYYVSPINGRRFNLPTDLKSENVQINFEQIITDKIKLYAQAEYLTKTARPPAISLTGRAAYALTERDFIKTEFTRAEETLNTLPSDGQGYFDLTSTEINYSRYITYDFILALGYGLTVESETFIDSTQIDRTASDSYQISLAYQGKKYRADIRSQFISSNTNYESQSFGGSLEWIF